MIVLFFRMVMAVAEKLVNSGELDKDEKWNMHSAELVETAKVSL